MTASVAVVTGAAGGIGAAIAAELSAGGATVVVADLDEAGATAVAERLGGSARGVHARRLDVTDGDEVAETAREIVDALGRVDVLVNNAGMSYDAPALDHDDATWQRALAVNLTGAFYCAREFARQMRASGGSIVNISSASGFKKNRPELHVGYDVAKAGVAHMTLALGAEWAPLGIRVNAVAPGYTATPMLEAVDRSAPGRLEQWLEQIPQGRLIEPAEIAQVVAFLASDAASSITGQTVLADAGYTAW